MHTTRRTDPDPLTAASAGTPVAVPAERSRHRRGAAARVALAVGTAALAVAALPGVASAGHGPGLVEGFHRRLIGMVESDPFLFDDGCIGGASRTDPLYVVVPSTDPATPTSACSARADAPIVVAAASISCWDTTAALAREECETAWADPARALVDASVTVDGRPKRLSLDRVHGCLVFAEGAVLDVPGTSSHFYGIGMSTTLRGLRPGTHIVDVSFAFADGFSGATTFAITITS